MIRLIRFVKPLNEYDDFILCHSSKNDGWMLIGEWSVGADVDHMHFIAISDSEEELRMWIDLRNIHIKEVIEYEYRFCQEHMQAYKNRKR